MTLLMILLLSTPLMVWFFYKPIRLFAPQLAWNLSCVRGNIYLEDSSKSVDAINLYDDAIKAVAKAIGSFKKQPNIIFCSTKECFEAFGFDKASAKTVGIWGIVVAPKGWRDYYIRHEMIHHRQAEELGVLAIIQYPSWFIEGMAYSLSSDSRPILSEPWQSYRTTFENWLQKVGRESLWENVPKE